MCMSRATVQEVKQSEGPKDFVGRTGMTSVALCADVDENCAMAISHLVMTLFFLAIHRT